LKSEIGKNIPIKQLEPKIEAAQLGNNLPMEVDGRPVKVYNSPNVTKKNETIDTERFDRIKEDMKLEDEMAEECPDVHTHLTARPPGAKDNFEPLKEGE
jgi:hypothetical protein